jgi:GNAT superfamily N-acetyltransferase
MIRECGAADGERIHFIINEAAQAYKGVIADDCWHEPYMPMAELRREMGEMTFFGWAEGDGLIGVMGYQPLGEVTLVRHAYVLPEHQSKGIGTRLLEHLVGMVGYGAPTLQGTSSSRLLVGTWAANEGAIRFYERHGFRLRADGQELLRRYWKIPARQRETSVVLEMAE